MEAEFIRLEFDIAAPTYVYATFDTKTIKRIKMCCQTFLPIAMPEDKQLTVVVYVYRDFVDTKEVI